MSKLGSYGFLKYDLFERWSSYWYQIRSVVLTEPNNVLLIGKGNGLVPDYLRQEGYRVDCADIQARLMPEILADVRKLSAHVPAGSFDTVCAFQILEHLPYADFIASVLQMAVVSRRHVLISLPVAGIPLSFRLRIKSHVLSFGRQFRLFRSRKISSHHQWEIGLKEHPLRKVLADLQAAVNVNKHYICPDNPYHYFFECTKRT
ncbi:MAG: methyltransferase domain-containing protein [Elusimicrobia bacterium]|nr:methyltransferase domain-containing protein [Elusimicrobiota bacterium]